LAGLLLIPLMCAPVAFLSLGACLANPFSALDPLLQHYWYGQITEGLPIWRQPLSVAGMLVWTLVLVLAGWWQMRREGLGEQGRARDLLALVAVLACLYAFWLMRAGIVAQLLAIPFAALLLATWLPKARALAQPLPRVGATLACFALATPIMASAALKPFDPLVAPEMAMLVEPGVCDYAQLASLPPGLVLAPLDAGPEILGQSRHTIVMASYHRNQLPMRDVILAFTAPLAEARAAVMRQAPDYLVGCTAAADFGLYRGAGPANLASSMAAGKVPDWLEPVAEFAGGPLKVYRVRQGDIRPGGIPLPNR
jgi:hypothetical protein